MCNKISFASWTAARDFCAPQGGHVGRRRRTIKALRPYLCPVCGDWHLTSQSIKREKSCARKQMKRAKCGNIDAQHIP